MAGKIEVYNGTEWLSVLVKLLGTNNQISIVHDEATQTYTIGLANNPVIPGDTTIDSTGYLKIPVGTTAERPLIPEQGMVRFNKDI